MKWRKPSFADTAVVMHLMEGKKVKYISCGQCMTKANGTIKYYNPSKIKIQIFIILKHIQNMFHTFSEKLQADKKCEYIF